MVIKMRKKNKHLPHEIVIDGEIGRLTAYTKKGKPVVAIFDTVDLPKIAAFQNWRAVWCAPLDCPMIESKAFINGRAVRTPVAAAILECSPNAPIRHFNVNILDNRRANLEIYDVKAQPNEHYVGEERVAMVLKDRYGRQVGSCFFDKDDLDLVINSGHVWLKKSRRCGQPYIISTEGILLAHLILGVEAGFVTYLNKNPLDNRRENVKLEKK